MENTGNMFKLIVINYSVWKLMIEDLLYMKDLWHPIKTINGVPVGKPAEIKYVDWEVLNRKCAGQIRQWIDRSIMRSIAKETDAYKQWKKLEKTYAQPSA